MLSFSAARLGPRSLAIGREHADPNTEHAAGHCGGAAAASVGEFRRWSCRRTASWRGTRRRTSCCVRFGDHSRSTPPRTHVRIRVLYGNTSLTLGHETRWRAYECRRRRLPIRMMTIPVISTIDNISALLPTSHPPHPGILMSFKGIPFRIMTLDTCD